MSNKFKISFEELPVEETVVQADPELELEDGALDSVIDESTEEVSRQTELVEGMENLKLIASKISTPTMTDIALFRVAANMAVAGTDQSAQSFLPAMESNQPIALEGFDEKIKTINDKITKLQAKIAELKKKKKDAIKSI